MANKNSKSYKKIASKLSPNGKGSKSRISNYNAYWNADYWKNSKKGK